eukprot:5645340-Alexandrium_andersonii.AAC.1
MSASLVGSEMCIRDSSPGPPREAPPARPPACFFGRFGLCAKNGAERSPCLLYTSDAADDM